MWQSTPYTVPCLVTGVTGVLMAAWVLARRRDRPAAREFVVACTLIAFWCLAYAGELARADMAGKDFFLHLTFAAFGPMPVAFLAFALRFSGRPPLPRRWLVTLSMPAAVIVVLGLTNGWHHWVLAPSHFVQRAGYTLRTANEKPLFWIYVAYAYALIAAATIAYGVSAVTGPAVTRRAGALMFAGSLIPWASNAAYLTRHSPAPDVDLTPMAFVVMTLVWGWVLARRRLLDLVPVARDAILEAMRDPFVVLDPSGRVLDANPVFARLVGSTPASLAARGADALGPFAALARPATSATSELSAGGRAYEVVVSEIARDARHARAVVLRDVTERQRMLEELVAARDLAQAADRAKGAFLARMSHEVRTPLHGILGAAELLARAPLDAEHRGFAEGIVSSGAVLLRVLSDILDFARLGSGEVALERAAFQPDKLVADTAALFQAMAAQKGVAVRARGEGPSPAVVGDEHRLRQVLFNVVGNAVKFTERGSVEIAWSVAPSDAGAELRLDVQDTGIGIPADLQERVFQPFVQADGGTARKHGGTGLGLTIARQLVSAMGGTLTLESAPGKGTRVGIRIGVALAPSLPAAPAAREAAGGSLAARAPRVLLAEDHPLNRLVLTAQLERLGCRVTAVAGGRAALDAVADEPPFELVLLDVRMPEIDGREVAQRLRADGFDAPIVAVTAEATPEEARACRDAGMDDVLVKPISGPDLRRGIESWLSAEGLAGDDDDAAFTPDAGTRALFRRTAAAEIDAIEVALAHADDARAREIVHGLRGASGMMGAAPLAAACARPLTAPGFVTSLREALRASAGEAA